MSDRTLLLAPSFGLGGGIERYVETLEWAFTEKGIEYRRINLSHHGLVAQRQMLAAVRKDLSSTVQSTRLVLAHPGLLPVATLATRGSLVNGISVVCHGSEAWVSRHRIRWQVEKSLLRRPDVRVVAVSNFTSGALLGVSAAAILPPGVSRKWFDTLVEASSDSNPDRLDIQLITTFRLADWRDKGLPQLLDALRIMRRDDVRLTVCGSGEASPDLLRFINQYEHCALRIGLSDSELARQLASADLLVLATRTRPGRRPSGEGFGLVLLEAQLAGTPVISPAYGGSHDAFVDQITGVAPADESAESLAKVLEELLSDRERLTQMGRRASEWARETFSPERYASRAIARLL